MRFVRATYNIPENVNFAIKTGAMRDFLDDSVGRTRPRRAKANSRRRRSPAPHGLTRCWFPARRPSRLRAPSD